MWNRLEQLIAQSSSTAALRTHGLHLFAARQWRAAGRAVPIDLRADEWWAALMAVAAPLLLQRARQAYGGQLMVMKGPEAAAAYPDARMRYYRDLDLLADDPSAAQRALLGFGFVEVGSPYPHHLPPLAWPGMPLIVEVHRRPNSPSWLEAPSVEELMRLAVPSATRVKGLLAPSPPAHALLLAAHGWAHRPLRRLGDLVDVVAVLDHADRSVAQQLARRWGWDDMWATTVAAADAILGGGPRPLCLSLWARHLRTVREQTVLEYQLLRVVAPVLAMPVSQARRSVSIGLGEVAARDPGESWAAKLRRSRRAMAHAFMDHPAYARTFAHTIGGVK